MSTVDTFDTTVEERSQGVSARRTLLRGLALGGISVAVSACAAGGIKASGGATATTVPAPQSTDLPKTPDGALQRLLEGNKRLLANERLHVQTLDDIRKHATGQSPYAQVFGCADSRVPVEVVFDEDFGDVFVTRTAGNVLSEPTIGTIEYGVLALNTPLIMVLGHQNCGAVKAAVDAAKDPSKLPSGPLGALVTALLPAAKAAKGEDVYASALEAHVRSVVTTLEQTPTLAEAIKAGKLRVVGASYDLATAKVTMY